MKLVTIKYNHCPYCAKEEEETRSIGYTLSILQQEMSEVLTTYQTLLPSEEIVFKEGSRPRIQEQFLGK